MLVLDDQEELGGVLWCFGKLRWCASWKLFLFFWKCYLVRSQKYLKGDHRVEKSIIGWWISKSCFFQIFSMSGRGEKRWIDSWNLSQTTDLGKYLYLFCEKIKIGSVVIENEPIKVGENGKFSKNLRFSAENPEKIRDFQEFFIFLLLREAVWRSSQVFLRDF